MSQEDRSRCSKPPVSRWRLWIDGCGGFLVLTGDAWTIGGPDLASSVDQHNAQSQSRDIRVHADLPRFAGTIHRQSDAFVWQAKTPQSSDCQDKSEKTHWLTNGKPIPIPGSAKMMFTVASPLCQTARLDLVAPHRFAEHVDAVILAGSTILIGQDDQCHIRVPFKGDLDVNRLTLTWKNDCWAVKEVGQNEFKTMDLGIQATVGQVAMTLESMSSGC